MMVDSRKLIDRLANSFSYLDQADQPRVIDQQRLDFSFIPSLMPADPFWSYIGMSVMWIASC